MGEFQKGMNLAEAAGHVGPILGLPPERIAGFVILAIDTESGTGPAMAASENISPAMAALLLHDAGVILGQVVAEAERQSEMN